MNYFKNVRKIKGDASTRNFYRKKNKKFNSILIYAKKEKNKNLLIYDAINKIFIKNKILAPKLYQAKFNKNFIEVQDFGNDTLFKILKKRKTKIFFYYRNIINLLDRIQLIKNRKIKNFKKKIYVIPKYKKKILIKEAELFCDWYAKKYLTKIEKKKFCKKFKQIIKKLSSNLKLKNDVFVHRDFHVSNLMLVNKQIGVIDSQDALIGNKAYDLASLIDDVRFETSILLKNKIYNLFLKKKNKVDKIKLINDFKILSVLRNLKIIGIFTRLSERDNKKEYLKLIPQAWKLIELRTSHEEIFNDLRILLAHYFKFIKNEN